VWTVVVKFSFKPVFFIQAAKALPESSEGTTMWRRISFAALAVLTTRPPHSHNFLLKMLYLEKLTDIPSLIRNECPAKTLGLRQERMGTASLCRLLIAVLLRFTDAFRRLHFVCRLVAALAELGLFSETFFFCFLAEGRFLFTSGTAVLPSGEADSDSDELLSKSITGQVLDSNSEQLMIAEVSFRLFVPRKPADPLWRVDEGIFDMGNLFLIQSIHHQLCRHQAESPRSLRFVIYTTPSTCIWAVFRQWVDVKNINFEE
jgi:hypothetical protein